MKPLRSVYAKILLITILVFVFPLTLLFLYGYHSLENNLRQKTLQIAESNLNGMNKNLQDVVDRVNKTASYLSTDVRLNDLACLYIQLDSNETDFSYSGKRPDYIDKYEYLNHASEIQTQLTNYADNWLAAGSSIALIFENGQFFCTWPSYNTDFEVLENIRTQSNADAFFSNIHSPLSLYDNTGDCFSFVKKIYNRNNTRQVLAKVIITTPVSALENILKNYQNDMFSFYIMEQSQNIVAQTAADTDGALPIQELVLQYETLYPDGTDQGVTLDHTYFDRFLIDGPGWFVCLSVPYRSIFQELMALRQTLLGGGAVLIVLLTIALLLLLYRLLLPLRKLALSMSQFEPGNWDTPDLPVTSQDEIGSLTECFNHLMARLRQMFVQIKEAERQRGELKFEMLLAQINPHFLFNTLNSIKFMAAMAHADNIVGTIRSLARLLDISMNRQKDVISIEEEIKNLKSYLDIQSIRYEGLFYVNFDIDEQLNHMESLKLVFQPIVENAIIHNIQQEEPLDIRITGQLLKNDVILEITDNGKGMSAQQIQQILSDDMTYEKSVFRGIGVNNVRQRLQLKYGAAYGVSIISAPGEGTKVRICFPAIPFEAGKGKGEQL